MLTGPEVVTAMAAAFTASEGLALPEHLLRTLEAEEASGGDRHGKQSAAIHVVYQEEYPRRRPARAAGRTGACMI